MGLKLHWRHRRPLFKVSGAEGHYLAMTVKGLVEAGACNVKAFPSIQGLHQHVRKWNVPLARQITSASQFSVLLHVAAQEYDVLAVVPELNAGLTALRSGEVVTNLDSAPFAEILEKIEVVHGLLYRKPSGGINDHFCSPGYLVGRGRGSTTTHSEPLGHANSGIPPQRCQA